MQNKYPLHANQAVEKYGETETFQKRKIHTSKTVGMLLLRSIFSNPLICHVVKYNK